MQDYIVMDGAMGTYIRKFVSSIKRSDQLNLTNSNLIKQIHKEYISSGAEIITTNTFITNYLGGYKDIFIEEIIVKGIKIAKEAISESNTNTRIALDVTKGDHYEVFGKIGQEERVDYILIETITSLNEMEIAIKEIKKFYTGKIIASFSFSSELLLKEGSTVLDVCDKIKDVDYLGINCGGGLERAFKLGVEFKKHSKIPLFIKPNLGLPNKNGEYNVSILEFEKWVKKYKEIGAKIIGGCCGTTPNYIKILK